MSNKNVKTVVNNRRWKTYSKIDEGFSDELKYHVTDYNNHHYLIKIASIEYFRNKQMLQRILNKIANLPFKKPLHFEYGYFNDERNVFSIQTWVDGEVVKKIMPKLSQIDRFLVGKIAGSNLRIMHSIPLDSKDLIPIELIKKRRTKKMLNFINSKTRTSYDNILVNFINDNINKIVDFNPCYIHHDFCANNMVIDSNYKFGIIDFDSAIIEDPVLDLVKVQIYDVEEAPEFCYGVLEGYFGKKIPNDFWLKYAVLTAYNCLTLSLWANNKGLTEAVKVNKIVKNVLKQYDNFNRIIPEWYYKLVIKPISDQFKFNKEFKIDITE